MDPPPEPAAFHTEAHLLLAAPPSQADDEQGSEQQDYSEQQDEDDDDARDARPKQMSPEEFRARLQARLKSTGVLGTVKVRGCCCSRPRCAVALAARMAH